MTKKKTTIEPKEIRQRNKRNRILDRTHKTQIPRLHQFFHANKPIILLFLSFFSGGMPAPTPFTTTPASLSVDTRPVCVNISPCFPTPIALAVVLKIVML